MAEGRSGSSHNFPAAVSRFDAQNGQLQQQYPHSLFLSSAPLAFGEGAAWSSANSDRKPGELLRIDALGGGSEAIGEIESPCAITVAFGAVWLTRALDDGEVLRVDPAAGVVSEDIEVGDHPSGVAAGRGSVWVANGGETTISEIDPRTNEVVDTIPTRYYPYDLVYGHGFLWVSLHARPFSWEVGC